MLKIGQNVMVGYPDRTSPLKPGVIYNKTCHAGRVDLYWVRVQERNGVTHAGDTYYEEDIFPLEPTPENPTPEQFSVGSYVCLDGESWQISAVEIDGDEPKYLVREYGMPNREVCVDELS